MRRLVIVVGVVVALVVGCAPEATVVVESPEAPVVARVIAPPPPPAAVLLEPYVLFSALDDDGFVEELDRLAKIVHPRYRLATRTVNYEGNNVARYLTSRLSNGVTRIVIWPFDQARVARVQPVVDAFLVAGVLTESGLPELEPVPVPVLTVSSGGEFFRFYQSTSRSELLAEARSCKSDYVINRDRDALGGVDFLATDMPDGRIRLLVDIDVYGPDMARVQELQTHTGLVLACLELRVGASTEK